MNCKTILDERYRPVVGNVFYKVESGTSSFPFPHQPSLTITLPRIIHVSHICSSAVLHLFHQFICISILTFRMSSAATKTFHFLTSAQVIRLHQAAIAKAQPSQPAMLESAVTSPMNIKYYEREENVFQLAANLAEKIMKNHAY